MNQVSNSDPNHNERVELRRAYQSLLFIRGELKKILNLELELQDKEKQNLDEVRNHCVQIRGIHTASRLANLLLKISDNVLESIDEYGVRSTSRSQFSSRFLDTLKLTGKGMRVIDNRLGKLREDVMSTKSHLIDERMGNYRFTLYGLVSTLYVGSLAFITFLLEVDIALSPILLLFAIVAIISFVDLFMVVWTRPFWLYLPSKESRASQLINSSHLWVLLVPLVFLILGSVTLLILEILSLFFSSTSMELLGLALSIFSIVSTVVLYRYAQWRKKEYLCCPNPRCAHLVLPKPSALLVHYEEEHGIELKAAVAELRTRLARKKKPKKRRFRNILGYFILAISWFFCFETLFLLRIGDIIRFLILIIADIVIIWWGFYEMHIILEPLPNNIPKRKAEAASKEAASSVLQFIMMPIFLKMILVTVFSILLLNLIGVEATLLVSIITYYNSGFTTGLLVPYLRKKYRNLILNESRWNNVFSNNRSATWISVIYIIYLIVGYLSFIGGFETLEILRFSYMTSDLIIFAWSTDLYSAIKNDLIHR